MITFTIVRFTKLEFKIDKNCFNCFCPCCARTAGNFTFWTWLVYRSGIVFFLFTICSDISVGGGGRKVELLNPSPAFAPVYNNCKTAQYLVVFFGGRESWVVISNRNSPIILLKTRITNRV